MGSYIKVDSVCIDLSNFVDMTNPGKCQHFSLRGYVSDIRKKDWRKCWPFPVNESEEQPPFPPLDAPKFRWWCCESCQQAIAAEGFDKNDRTNFNQSDGCRPDSNYSNAVVSSGIQQALTPSSTLMRIDIDLNKAIDLSSDSDSVAICNEIENNAEVVHSKITDHDIGFENNLNHQVSSVPSPEVYPDFIQELHTNKRGCEGNEVSNTELVTGNPSCMDKISSEIYNEGTAVAEEDTEADHTIGNLPPESVACNLPVGNTDKFVKKDFQDRHQEKYSGLSRKRHRRTRLLADLLNENDEPKTEQITKKGSTSNCPSHASAASQTLSVFRDKVNVQEDTNLTNSGQGRKRKFRQDEEGRVAYMCLQRVENEVQNLEGDAKTIDTTPDNRSKDVLTGLQDTQTAHRHKPEIERSHTMGKKNKKVQHVDDHLIAKPHQGSQRENEHMVDVANKECASKALSSGLFPCASTEKGMDSFPLHAPRTENDCIFSKGKGKILQADEMMDSLSCWKNDNLVEGSVAHRGGKSMSNMPLYIPISSAEGAPNEEGLEEGPHLSLNCYSSAPAHNRRSIHKIENRLALSLPLQEGTSKPKLKRKDSETNFFGEQSIPSKHKTNAISGKGEGFHLEESKGARIKGKAANVVEQDSMKIFYDLTGEEESELGTLDDVPMEVVEIMAKNQYERSLPDVENVIGLLEKSTQREKPLERDGENRILTGGETVLPGKGNSINNLSPIKGNKLGMNNLCKIQSPFGFEVPSGGVYFSPLDTKQLVPAQTSEFNRSISQCGLRKSILRQDGASSQVWTSLTENNASLGFDEVPKQVVSLSTSSNMDLISLPSGSLSMPNKKRDIDLNLPDFDSTNSENLGGSFDYGNSSRTNEEYPFIGKNNGIEPCQNLSASPDLYSNEAISAMHLLSLLDAGKQSTTSFSTSASAQMIKRPFYPGECNTKLDIGTSKAHGSLKRQLSCHSSKSILPDKSHGYFSGSPIQGASSSIQYGEKFIHPTNFNGQHSTKSGKREKNSSNTTRQNGVGKQFSRHDLERETSLQHGLEVSVPLRSISESLCRINRNPAELIEPEVGNAYMINGDDLNFDGSILERRPDLPTQRGRKQKRNL